MPDIYPRLAYDDERAAFDYLVPVFQLAEIREARTDLGDNLLAWLRVGDGVVMIGRANAEIHRIHSPHTLGNTTVQMMVCVHDVDAHYADAVAEGADITMPIEDACYGERRYEATDLEGHRWHFAERFNDIKARRRHHGRRPVGWPARTRIAVRVLVQIYGITTAEDAAAVNVLRPDHVGLVLDEGVDTWDSINEIELRALRHELTDVRVVALSLSTDPARIRQTVDTVEPHILHLARAVGIERRDLEQLRSSIEPVELMTTVPVRDGSALGSAQRLAPVSDFLLLDSEHPDTGIVGATGVTHDWTLSTRIVRDAPVPVFLAGGLGPANVRAAITSVRPAGVDSETRTSMDTDRRRKDLSLVEEFIRLAWAEP